MVNDAAGKVEVNPSRHSGDKARIPPAHQLFRFLKKSIRIQRVVTGILLCVIKWKFLRTISGDTTCFHAPILCETMTFYSRFPLRKNRPVQPYRSPYM